MSTGQGTYISGVAQIRDPYLDARYREQSTYLGDLDTTLSAYKDLENLFDDVTSTGMQALMTKFLGQLQEVSNHSEKPEIANTLLTSAKNIVQMLSTYDSKLEQITSQNQTGLEISVQNVNSILEKLASLNEQIKADTMFYSVQDPITSERRQLGPYGPNELYDDRNMLLDQLSSYGEIDVKPESDGTITVTFGGAVVLKDHNADKINLYQDEAGNNVMQWDQARSNFKSESGSIKSYVDIISGKGGYAKTASGENDFNGIPFYREVLNSFANEFATKFNAANDVAGTGTGASDLFVKNNPTDTSFTISNIRISDSWMSDPQFIVRSDDPAQGDLSNSNIMKMISFFDETVTFGSADGTHAEFTGTYEGFLTHFQTKLGNEKQYVQGVFDSTVSVANELLDSRDSISGVSENEEAINMMKFQKAFNAAARLMTAIDEQLDTIINKLGRVGL